MKENKKVGIALNTKKSNVTTSTLSPWLSDSCAIEDCDHKKAYYGDFAASERLNKKSDGTISLEKMGELYENAQKIETKTLLDGQFIAYCRNCSKTINSQQEWEEYHSKHLELVPKDGNIVETNGVQIEVKDSAPDGEILAINADNFKLAYSHDQLLQALYWIFDAFERSNMTFFATYNTAESVLDQKDLEGDKITVGIRDMIWESGARQIFDTYVQYKDKEDNKFTYIADNGVPVEVMVFKDDECIMSPDIKMYHSEAFHLPNPYSRFLEVYK